MDVMIKVRVVGKDLTANIAKARVNAWLSKDLPKDLRFKGMKVCKPSETRQVK